ncbi:MAG TPA: hypothetical protein VKX49_16420 [Bryobacteraceae bacterium]|nr:hypothetical protein [Bryobacteraceae bacterium]
MADHQVLVAVEIYGDAPIQLHVFPKPAKALHSRRLPQQCRSNWKSAQQAVHKLGDPVVFPDKGPLHRRQDDLASLDLGHYAV